MFLIKRQILLHIGWPKTGTTTLQKHVFPNIDKFRYIGKTPFDGQLNKFTFKLVYILSYSTTENFAIDADSLFNELVKKEKGLFGDNNAEKPLLISEEGILSSLLKPSDHQHHGFSVASLKEICRRLKALEEIWNVEIDILNYNSGSYRNFTILLRSNVHHFQ